MPGAVPRVLEQNPRRLVYSDQRLFADGRRGGSGGCATAAEELLGNPRAFGVMFPAPPGGRWRPPPACPRAPGLGLGGAHGRSATAGYGCRRHCTCISRSAPEPDATQLGPQWRRTFVGMMQETFPELYRGERPMGCCGKRSAARPRARQLRRSPWAPDDPPGIRQDGRRALHLAGAGDHLRARRPVIYVTTGTWKGWSGWWPIGGRCSGYVARSR